MSGEEWRPIPTFEGAYEVSNLGHVRSLARKVTQGNGKVITVRDRELKVLTQRDGHRYVSLSRTGERKPIKVCVDDLIREAFEAGDVAPVAEPAGPTTGGEVVPFAFDDHQVRVIVDLEGNPWWVAADVAEVLGYRDAANAVRTLRDRQVRTQQMSTNAGARQVLIINEGGLYRLILRSTKPDAERFQDWVTDEMLPSIRRTGQYVAPPVVEQAPATSDVPAVRDQFDVMRALLVGQLATVDELARQERELHAVEGHVTQLDERVTAIESAPNWCTSTAWAQLRGWRQTDVQTLGRLGKRAASLARARELDESKVLDINGRFYVHRWPAVVWDEAATSLGWTS